MKNYNWPKLDLDDPQIQQEWLWRIFAPYSNPWWMDPRDLTQDKLARIAAQEWFEGQCVRGVRRAKRRRQAFVFCALLVVPYWALAGWLGGMSDSGLDYTKPIALWGSPVFILFLLIPFKRFRREWAEMDPYREFFKLKKQLEERSVDDYRYWLTDLRTTDPNLFFQINTWSQNERALEIQRHTLIAAQRAADAAEAAAYIASENESNTRAIRNQIKYGHE